MTQPADDQSDMAALARGGRTNFFGFVLRLMARMPFLFIAGRLYGAESLGRFAYATMVVELAAQLATLGLKRGLAAELTRSERPHSHVIADALLLSTGMALLAAALLALVPEIVFPNTRVTGLDRAFALVTIPIVISDVTLAALAFRHRIGPQVTARSIVEPWVLTLAAAAIAFTPIDFDGLIIAYAISLTAAMLVSLRPCIQLFGWPRGWRPKLSELVRLARENVALAGADAIEWATRRLDIAILGLFTGPAVLGIYYVAQQVATLAQKLKTSFDPILGPVITRNLEAGDRLAIAGQMRQVGFWVTAAQLGVALTLGMTGEAVMGLVGPEFVSGAIILAFLLSAEVLAATAAVSESALIFTNPNRNLMWSVVGISLQAALTLALVPFFGAPGAAAGLALSAAFVSIMKARLLKADLGARVAGWRWAMLLATCAALVVGLVVQLLPPFWQIGTGIPTILATYAAVLWFKGFRATDRLLFARRKAA